MKPPNFFIVGAPKSGTTALSTYLGQHENIFMCSPKEPHFFADDLPGYQFVRSEQEYLSLFEKACNVHKAVGEASVYYMYSSCACKNILKFNKDSLIIAMLRNPVDLVYSLHSQLVYTRNETINNFRSAWKAQSERKQGRRIPFRCKDYKILFYQEVGMIGSQIQRLYDLFPRDQIKIILFDDFVKSPKHVYNGVLSFLGVDSDGRNYFPVINENCMHRIAALSVVSNRVPFVVQSLVRNVKYLLGIKREFGVTKKIKEINTLKKKRKPLDKSFRQELVSIFNEDIDLLSSIIHRDLSNWKV